MADIKTVQLILTQSRRKAKLQNATSNWMWPSKRSWMYSGWAMQKALRFIPRRFRNWNVNSQKHKPEERITKTLKSLDKATPNELKRTIRVVNCFQIYYLNIQTFFNKPDENLKLMLIDVSELPLEG